jgi:hypothetical protein
MYRMYAASDIRGELQQHIRAQALYTTGGCVTVVMTISCKIAS